MEHCYHAWYHSEYKWIYTAVCRAYLLFCFLFILELNKEISILFQWSYFWPCLYVQKCVFHFLLYFYQILVLAKNLFKFFALSQFPLFAFSMSSFHFSKSLDGDRWSVWRGPGRVVARPDWVFLIHRSCQKTRARAKVRNITSFFVCHFTWKDPPVVVFPLMEVNCEWLKRIEYVGWEVDLVKSLCISYWIFRRKENQKCREYLIPFYS